MFKELFESKKITYTEYKNTYKKMTKIERAKYKDFAEMLRKEEFKQLLADEKEEMIKIRNRILGK